jgi:hypothetical protein
MSASARPVGQSARHSPDVEPLLDAVHHRQQGRPQREDMRAHGRVARVQQAAAVEQIHRLPGPAGEGQRPDPDRLQRQVVAQDVLGQRVEPAREQPHAPLPQQRRRMPGQQLDGTFEIAAFERVVDGRHRPLLRRVPAGRGAMQTGHLGRRLALQLRFQEIGNQAVVAPGPVVALDRRDQAGRLEMAQDRLAVHVGQQRLTQRRAQIAQDAGAQQEAADRLGLSRDDVLGQILGNRAVRAGKTVDEIGVRLAALERRRREPQRGRPAFGLAMKPQQILGGERHRPHGAEELFGFLDREAQRGGVDFQQLAAGAQAAQLEVGQAARPDDQPAVARQVIDDLAHPCDDARFLQHLEVVEEQREGRGVAGQAVHGQQCDLADRARRRPLGIGRRVVAENGRQRRLETGQEAHRIVVGAVEREPGRRDRRGLQLRAVLQHRGRLAEARGRADNHQLGRRRGAQPVGDTLSDHVTDRRGGRTELHARHMLCRDRRRGHLQWMRIEAS